MSQDWAASWNWRNPVGQLKDMAARTLVLQLEQRGWIPLPPRRRAPANRMRHKRMAALLAAVPESPVLEDWDTLLPLAIGAVSRPAGRRALFENRLHRQHYWSYRSPVGGNLQSLVSDRQGRPLAGVRCGAAAGQCADQDEDIGWDAAPRGQGLHLIANPTRFLILPWVRGPSLASPLLRRVARRLRHDGQDKYGPPIYLVETFVQRDRFVGSCYRAANWPRVGQTQGRSRPNRPEGRPCRRPSKDGCLYALPPRFRPRWQGAAAPPQSMKPPQFTNL